MKPLKFNKNANFLKKIIFLLMFVLLIGSVSATRQVYYDCEEGSGSNLIDQENNRNGAINPDMLWNTTVPSFNVDGGGGSYSCGFLGTVQSTVNVTNDWDTLLGFNEGFALSAWWLFTGSTGSGDRFWSPYTEKRITVSSPYETDDHGLVVFSIQNPTFHHVIGTINVTGGWTHVVFNFDGSNMSIWVNGTIDGSYTPIGTIEDVAGDQSTIGGITVSDIWCWKGLADEMKWYNDSLTTTQIQELYNYGTCTNCTEPVPSKIPPNVTSVNCTSCNKPYGDNTSPYTTPDTTPTFKITTDINASCTIADKNWNYTTMDATRNCSREQGNNHTCTLRVKDELVFSQDYVYISCANTLNNNQTWNATKALEMNITDLVVNQSLAIERGIHNSVIWPGATIYSNQQVYLRNLNNQQLLATVDRVAVYGNQRWIVNYVGESESPISNLFNITPVVYSLEMINISTGDIESQVTALIDSTKS